MVIFVIPVPKLGKKVISKKRQFMDLSGSQNSQKSNVGIKTNMNNYIISKTLFCEKAGQII